MADSPDKEQEKQKKEDQKRANKPIVTVCTLNLRQILVALHEKALKEVGEQKSGDLALTIQNSAIEGAGGKDAKFYGAGQHIIACIPKEAKGLDKNKVLQKDAIGPLKTYIQWFVGPDLKKGVEEKDLLPLEDGAEGKVDDNHEKKEDIEKSKKDSVAGEKYESTIFVPSFSQYLLTEEGEAEGSEEGGEDKDKSKDKDKGKEAAEEEKGTSEASAQGWYVQYKLTIPGQKEHALADAMKSLGKDIIKAVGVKFTSLFGGDSETHTIGGLMDDLDSVFGKLDAKEFESQFNQEMQKKMKQTSASAAVWDTATILKYLKKEVGSSKSKITPAKYALCVRVDKNDKSYKLFNEDAIANLVNAAINGAMRGVFKKAFYGVKSKDVILVNNYSDNKKAKDSDKFETRGKAAGAVADSMKTVQTKPLILETVQRKHDLLDCILEECFRHIDMHISKMSCIKTGNALLESMFDDIGAELLTEKNHKPVDDKKFQLLKKTISAKLDAIRDSKDKIIKDAYTECKSIDADPWPNPSDKRGYDDFINAIFGKDDADAVNKQLGKICHRENFVNDIVYRFVKATKDIKQEEKEEDAKTVKITFYDADPKTGKKLDKPLGDPIEIDAGTKPNASEEVSDAQAKYNKKLSDDKKEGYTFKGWSPETSEAADEDTDIVAKYIEDGKKDEKFTVMFQYAPDQEKPDDVQPIEVDGKEQQEVAAGEKAVIPEAPEIDGYVFKEWDADGADFDKVDKDIMAVAKYEKKEDEQPEESSDSNVTIYFKVQDPAFQNKTVKKLSNAFEPIVLGQKKDKDGKVVEDVKLDDVEFPKHNDASNVPDGYTTRAKSTWTIASTNETAIDADLKEKVKAAIDKDKEAKSIYAVLNLIPRSNFTISIVETDPEKPEDESKEKELAKIEVVHDESSGKNIYQPDDIKKLSDAIHSSEYPDEKYAKFLDKASDGNAQTLKKIEQTKTSSDGKHAIDPDSVKKDIEQQAADPKDDQGNKFEPAKLPPDKRIVKVKITASKDSFTVKIVQPDAEDPENTKTQKDVATISVFIVDDKRLYKPDDLSELAKSTKSKDEADRYSKAAKDNEDAFKKVDNIQALTKDNAPYKFIGWAGPDGEVESGEDALQKIIDKGPADGEEELVVKAAFDNDMKAKHTDIDFYIVPMKGLADKASKSK